MRTLGLVFFSSRSASQTNSRDVAQNVNCLCSSNHRRIMCSWRRISDSNSPFTPFVAFKYNKKAAKLKTELSFQKKMWAEYYIAIIQTVNSNPTYSLVRMFKLTMMRVSIIMLLIFTRLYWLNLRTVIESSIFPVFHLSNFITMKIIINTAGILTTQL